MARQPRGLRPAVRSARRRTAAPAFEALTVEGALIAPAQLALVAAREAGAQGEADYGVPRGLALRDEIARYFRIGQALFADLAAADPRSCGAATRFTEALLRDVLGFADVRRVGWREKDERRFAVTLEAGGGRVPVVVTPPADGLDRPSASLASEGGRAPSAALALQDWLNAGEGALWGLACNGERLRLVRDNPSLTRPAYVEADLRRLFEGEAFADFTALWLLLHASRFSPPSAPPSDCALERWRDAGQKAGVAARDRLRDGVEAALQALGDGFVRCPANADLRLKLESGELPLPAFHGLLLRLVYRMIFLLVAEDRGLLHPPDAAPAARTLYGEGYGVSRLRDRAIRRSAWDAHDDLWDGLLIVFEALGARGEPALGLPALDGLFARGGLGELERAALPNKALMAAIFRLAWLKDEGALVPVNWRDMETEELGSVYESLLELTPRLAKDGRGYGFKEGPETKGNQRKSTGSYYTPDSLVQVLLDSALDPVLDRVEREADDPAEALLGVTVIDPACGSGHFLLAAARRIATRVARAKAGGTASAADYRHALRDVARRCIHGVDRNPMAVELTKVALWIETVEPGKPLGFLDANIRCGDALLGVFDLDALVKGVPDAAYRPLAGDDKAATRALLVRNRAEREGQGALDFAGGGGRLPPTAPLARAARDWRALPEDSLAEIAARRARWEATRADPRAWSLRVACDLYVAAFLTLKPADASATAGTVTVPTTGDVWQTLAGRGARHGLREGKAVDLASEARAFHWPLEFTDVMAAGGFDVVLGNPPWETMSPDAKEFFSTFDPDVRFLSPEEQKARITELKALPGVELAWEECCRALYVSANFFRESGRYKFFAEGNLGKGDFNVYRMFVELALRLVRSGGRAAQFVPENLYNGANAAAIRRHLFEATRLHALIGFENTGKVWFEIDTRSKFCLYVASPHGTTVSFPAAFGVNSADKLAALRPKLPFDVPVTLVHEFSPDALSVAEIAHPSDLTIARKLYARFSKFGAAVEGLPRRNYSRELDMGNDREDFSGAAEGLPVYEGRMVEAFDHRAKAWISGRGRAAVWRELPFGSPEKGIRPQWRVAEIALPRKLRDRWRRYRIGFCDVASPTNQRAFVAALIPPDVVCGHKVPTLELEGAGVETDLLLLGAANAICIDYVVRKKVALSMTFTIVDSLPLPRAYAATGVEREIARRVLRLTATGPEMALFWRDVAPLTGLDPIEDDPVADPEQRRSLRAELDVLVARDLYGLTRDEMRYLLDPADILGPDAGFETFGALKRADEREFGGRFLTRDLILEAWDRLPIPVAQDRPAADHSAIFVPALPIEAPRPAPLRPHPRSRPDIDWARPPADAAALRLQTLVQVAAVLKALDGPAPSRQVRLAALFALEPWLLTARLDGDERAQWRRVVGGEADSPAAGVVPFGLGGAAGWGDALAQLRASNSLVLDAVQDAWAPGPGLSRFATVGWVERAGFAVEAAARIFAARSAALTADETSGLAVLAA